MVGDVGKLAVFAGVHKFPARVKCAILAWHAVMAALKGEGQPVTTEREDTEIDQTPRPDESAAIRRPERLYSR